MSDPAQFDRDFPGWRDDPRRWHDSYLERHKRSAAHFWPARAEPPAPKPSGDLYEDLGD